MIEILKSEIDDTVNFVDRVGEGEVLEARYVRRHDDYVACYLSTQTACAQTCRMCHLTATGQVKPRDATHREIMEQAQLILNYAASRDNASLVHFNFMARGEPLASEIIQNHSEELFLDLGHLAQKHEFTPRFLISTIMPESLPATLNELFPIIHPDLYYSIYSMNPDFRKRWMPRAMDPNRALELLTDWQMRTKKTVCLHLSLIEGENDTVEDAEAIVKAVKGTDLRISFTLVPYNPAPGRPERESTNYETYAKAMQSGLPEARVKTINRVGMDIAGSCGMFVS